MVTEQPNLCIVMEYCEGGDLMARITAQARHNEPFVEQQVSVSRPKVSIIFKTTNILFLTGSDADTYPGPT